jgi:membrane protease YdiL (CAAX protease family)
VRKNIGLHFLALTFAMAVISSGIMLAFGAFGFTLDNAPWLWAFFLVLGWSPTTASYIALKKSKQVSGFKDWLRHVFAFRAPLRYYLMVILFVAVYEIPQIVFTGFGDVKAWYVIFALIPLCFVGGGLEEAGWSYVLRPLMEKKFGYIRTALLFTPIWVLWHIPVYLPQGGVTDISSGRWLALFAIMCLGQAFGLGAVMPRTKNVWLCVMYHTLFNISSGMIYEYSDSIPGNVLASSLLMVVSIAAVYLHDKNKKELIGG